ncbi:MAG: UDP-3-O-(3-hydroxymyristoyl)glucosamine N-acyltransferase [Rhodobacteraceae bacterium]|jgi:UDP-3-O-[3-hydroxymyristoyl] glucosamine N-acyltransferase|uniref:UDP-3-O-acylglucosamine N-acyltransferase n=1 Tax=Salipiger profundus TaxID=1229727 RepID=A0A1U7D9N7_9RHOB|nr:MULTISPECIES: UDP-3-O-(3-hydroxymyristoyl)glucosamine N-acyltransferase [Salipiger]APX24775.1 UDP-3-O-(3-hydroxymyristoyl) glucosamine N-acyltransferase [Salipiger profundus]MAB07694.1 UDP-3-O-(3-hydroxymyristoyl)glucosamine N-acyltransferase [Paracoccaceae bacterium]GFZ97735.1 UDP-3-O-(3-hydroxymyristoyl)glucosamine N-acyltransferase [Salipiger profundus]SFC99591.1 UDP-3-O-[3-hydroxymyristoyl] glucosamine N-acyltransferase [Salipiger profundus]
MPYSIFDIATALGLEAQGDTDLEVSGVNEPALAASDELALAMKPEFAAQIADGQAQAAMLWQGADWQALGLRAALLAPRPRHALSGLSAMMDPGPGYGGGIHQSAIVDPSARLGEGVSIGPFSIVGAGAEIGAGTIIGPQCHVGWQSRVGAGSLLHTGVRIGARVTIGARFIAQPGAVVGGDGFSFVTPEPSGVEQVRETLGRENDAEAQSWARIHSLGGVTIADDVELGANACIDRGTVRDTVVGEGTKIDNLVQVGHNVVIGRNCLLCGQVGIAGSTVLGDNVVLGGQTGVVDNIRVGDRVITGAGTMLMANVPAGRAMLGYPATKMDAHVESYKAIRRLPRLFREVAALKKAVSKPGGDG